MPLKKGFEKSTQAYKPFILLLKALRVIFNNT